MVNEDNILDLSSKDILLEVISQINDPLIAIIKANRRVANQLFVKRSSSQKVSEETLQNSQRIVFLIEEIINKAMQSQEVIQQPIIFELYKSNPQIKTMCKRVIDPRKISQADKEWLLALENVVINEIKLNRLSLAEIASKVSVSERQLYRSIKKILSFTPNTYIRILKLHKAKQLIDKYKTISELSYAVGFSDVHYFSKIFFNQYGKTPKDLITT